MMRRILFTWALVLTLCVGAAAYQFPDTDAVGTLHTDYINNSPKAQAEMLRQLGLFRGTGNGFALERPMTRCEAAVMLVRLLGGETQALSGTWEHPYTDVPVWASHYVGWLTQKGLTRGVSATRYGAAQNVSCEQYAVLLTRVLRGSDQRQFAGGEPAEKAEADKRGFTRGDALALSVRALQSSCDGTVEAPRAATLAARLVSQGVFSARTFGEASFAVFPSSYYADEDGRLCRWTCEVNVAACPERGLAPAEHSESPALVYLPASRVESNGTMTFFALDCKTMAVQAKSAGHPAPDGFDGLTYCGSVGGTDYLMERMQVVTEARRGALLAWNGAALTQTVDARSLWGGNPSFRYTWLSAASSRLLCSKEACFVLDGKDCRAVTLPAGAEARGFDGTNILFEQDGKTAGLIARMEAASGKVCESYSIPYHEPDPNAPEGSADLLVRGVGADVGDGCWGQAGWYRLIGGRLTQMTDQPVNQLVFNSRGDAYLLTHKPLKRRDEVLARSNLFPALPGDAVLRINRDGTRSIALSADCGHGIAITAIQVRDDKLLLRAEYYDGQQTNTGRTDYLLVREGAAPSIRVLDLRYAHTEVGPKDLQTVQQHFNALGIGI